MFDIKNVTNKISLNFFKVCEFFLNVLKFLPSFCVSIYCGLSQTREKYFLAPFSRTLLYASVKCQVNKPLVEQRLVYFAGKIYTRIPYVYNWWISSFPATIVSGLRGGLHTGPHKVEATVRLKKKETPLEAAWEGVLSWEALRPLMERNPDEASADPPTPPPGGLRPQKQSVLAQA